MFNIKHSKAVISKYVEIVEEKNRHRSESSILEAYLDLISSPVTTSSSQLIKTGLRDYDSISGGGLRGGEVLLIGSRSNDLAKDFVLYLIDNIIFVENIPCAYFSLESYCLELTTRMVANYSGISNITLNNGLLSRNDRRKLSEGISKIFDTSLLFIDQIKHDYEYITHLFYHLYYQESVQIYIIENLEGISYIDPHSSELSDREEVCFFLKRLAKELDVIIIILEKIYNPRVDTLLSIDDLNKKGTYAKNIDLFLFLQSYPSEEGLLEVVLKVQKQQMGTLGLIDLSYTPRFNRFEDIQEFIMESNEYI